jgi:indole-3-glycerol phosphate synthase
MINGSDDRYQILAATELNIDAILVVAQTLNIGIYWHILL